MSKKRILVGEDDRSIRFALSEFLQSNDYLVTEATTCEAIRQNFRTSTPDAAILDYSLPDGTALDLLPFLKQTYASVPLILLTGNGTIELAVQAIKEGAEQFLTKPVQMSVIGVVLERALKNQRNHQKQLAGKVKERRESVDPFVGVSAAIRQVAEEAERVCGSHCSVLIAGETGSGKGVLARWLHDHSPRAEEPFVDLNCAGFGRELLESELFGHEAGAFTGAVARKLGLLEVAQKGTVFLDEIGGETISSLRGCAGTSTGYSTHCRQPCRSISIDSRQEIPQRPLFSSKHGRRSHAGFTGKGRRHRFVGATLLSANGCRLRANSPDSFRSDSGDADNLLLAREYSRTEECDGKSCVAGHRRHDSATGFAPGLWIRMS
jgi:FixJ family two-component response regulator